ncbi:hypothetical protein GCM10007907_33250 [Chitinimonas prasina]|uniref:Flagellar protein n=1 Tax=Chitinimonas prasina TaxID=1434937 RepID=A0ABQ5YHQ1_9NEIS|nr:flagellar biosynthetic protein FliO [Chitinimonas prasina]GLR14535.1 hypothetical protein GCM10007907_33250 [Chitinimonas prasina]
MRLIALSAAALSAAVSVCVLAAEPAKAAAAMPVLSSPAGPSLLSLVQVFFSLLLVIGAIFGSAWLMRRMTPGHLGGQAQLRVVGGVMVGAKERVVVVELRDTWLVLGVTPNKVSTLHTLPRPDDLPQVAVPVPFAEKLASVIKARRSGEGTQ